MFLFPRRSRFTGDTHHHDGAEAAAIQICTQVEDLDDAGSMEVDGGKGGIRSPGCPVVPCVRLCRL
jgi:hypothetical protein